MCGKEYDPDNPGYAEDDEITREDIDWGDPEARMLRLEDEDDDEEENTEVGGRLGVFHRLDELLAEYTPEERRLFFLVFVEGVSIAAASREAGVTGNVHVKFKKMLETVREELGDDLG
jgi:DNA-directed RNA polymerase specialized sigma24 family protein